MNNRTIKLKKNIYVSCPRCIENNKDKDYGDGVREGWFKVIELNKVYEFECSVCGLKLEYIINAMPNMTILEEGD